MEHVLVISFFMFVSMFLLRWKLLLTKFFHVLNSTLGNWYLFGGVGGGDQSGLFPCHTYVHPLGLVWMLSDSPQSTCVGVD